MPAPISVEVWAVIGQWIVYIGGLAGAIIAVYNLYKLFRSKTAVAKLEERVNKHDVFLDRDNQRLQKVEHQLMVINDEQQDLKEVIRLLLSSNMSMLNSMLHDGNNKDGMQKSYDDIQDYLNKQI